MGSINTKSDKPYQADTKLWSFHTRLCRRREDGQCAVAENPKRFQNWTRPTGTVAGDPSTHDTLYRPSLPNQVTPRQRAEAQRGKNTGEYCPARAAPLRGGGLRTHIQPSDGTCSPHGGAAKGRHNQTAPQRAEAQRGKNTGEYCPARAAPLRGGGLRTHIQPSDGASSPHGTNSKNAQGSRRAGCKKVANPNSGHTHRQIRSV